MATVAIALTGEPGAGKSTAAQWFRARGAALLDADGIVRGLWDGGELPEKARARWGESVFGADGKIDKKAVAARVFADDEEYRWLCRVTHPVVLARMGAALPEDGVVVAEIPMLFEVGRPDWVICNDGSMENLEAQLEKIWREIQALRSRREAQTDC